MSLSDLELVRIAKCISDISELGLLLKFKATEVDTFEEENENDMVLKKGTKNMLKQWNKREDSTKEKLVEALRLCEMENLAQEVERGILTEQHKVFMQQDEQPSNTVTDAVPDDKLNTLVTHVPHGKYTDLANRLGINFTPASSILVKYGQDYMKAIRECLAIWKDRTGGSKAELEEILCRAEIGALVEHIEK